MTVVIMKMLELDVSVRNQQVVKWNEKKDQQIEMMNGKNLQNKTTTKKNTIVISKENSH